MGIEEFCICPGGRNSAFIDCLKNEKRLKTYFFFDERSAAFFAIGRSKATEKPTAVITTSGTAVGELLPAAMEAYYSGIPLLLITADRPAIFRGSGAPQSAEQKNIFGIYTPFFEDVEEEANCFLALWNQKTPGHINVCLEEKYVHNFDHFPDLPCPSSKSKDRVLNSTNTLTDFLKQTKYPIAIIGGLQTCDRKAVIDFLVQSRIPAYCEAISGIREEPSLAPMRIYNSIDIKKLSATAEYPIDGVLRIGTVPTTRFWRDLEKLHGKIKVFSLSHLPFSGLSWGSVLHADISDFLRYTPISNFSFEDPNRFLQVDHSYHHKLTKLIGEEPHAEVSMVHNISLLLQKGDTLYLGNSLPIREWDLAATYTNKEIMVHANRGVNGIDGQMSTFLGAAKEEGVNWSLFGDLTALYDMTAPWIINQLSAQQIAIIVINNGGGKIFSRLFENRQIQNEHDFDFKHMAAMWRINYERWEKIPKAWRCTAPTLIECVPDKMASDRFWEKLV